MEMLMFVFPSADWRLELLSFFSPLQEEPASSRIIRVSLTSIQKETGRERTWGVSGEKNLCFLCCQKEKKKKYTKIGFNWKSLCVKKQSLFHTSVMWTLLKAGEKNIYFKDMIVAVLL